MVAYELEREACGLGLDMAPKKGELVMKAIRARYRNGVFEPMEEVEFTEDQMVEVFPCEETEDWVDDPELRPVIAERLRQIDEELRTGQFKTLEALRSQEKV